MKRLHISMKKFFAAIAVVIGLGGILYAATPSLMVRAANKYGVSGDGERSILLQKKIIEYFPRSDEAHSILIDWADFQNIDSGRFIITRNGSGGGRIVPLKKEQLIRYLEKFRKESIQNWKDGETAAALGKLYQDTGEYEKAIQSYQSLIDYYKKSGRDYYYREAVQGLAGIYKRMGDYNKAIQTMEKVLEEAPSSLHRDLHTDLGDLYMEEGNFTKAEAMYQIAEKEYRDQIKNFPGDNSGMEKDDRVVAEDIGANHIQNRLEQIRRLKENGMENIGNVKGKILRAGEPLGDVRVYLLDGSTDGFMSNLEEFSLYSATTRQDGTYTIPNVLPGKYLLGLGLLPEQVKDVVMAKDDMAVTIHPKETVRKDMVFSPLVTITAPVGKIEVTSPALTVKWQEYPGADHYAIIFGSFFTDKDGKRTGGSSYGERITNIKGTEYVLPLTGLAARQLNSVSYSENGIEPGAFLGFAYKGSEFFLGVAAYDKEGKKISDSIGYGAYDDGRKPLVTVNTNEPLSPGDQLVVKREYPKALEAYRQALKENPEDINALLSLARMYQYGYQIEKGSLVGSDPSLAAEYYGKLLDIRFNPYIAGEAFRVLMLDHQYERTSALLEKVKGSEAFNAYDDYLLAICALQLHDMDKAADYMDQYRKEQDILYNLDPALIYLAAGDYGAALDVLQQNNFQTIGETHMNDVGLQGIRKVDIPQLVRQLGLYMKKPDGVVTREEIRKDALGLLSFDSKERKKTIDDMKDRLEPLKNRDAMAAILLELAKDKE